MQMNYNTKHFLKKASPTILTCLGVAGMIATTILAVKATPKAIKLIDNSQQSNQSDSKLDIVRSCWKCYIPSLAMGTCTLLCIFGSNILNKKQQTSLAGAYAFLNHSFSHYRDAAKTLYGDEADKKINAQVAKEVSISADGCRTYIPEIDPADGDVLFFDSFSKRYFTSTPAAVIDALYHLNRNFSLRGYASVNEFYSFLGLDPIDCGDEILWDSDLLLEHGIIWIDFDSHLTTMDDNLECVILSMLCEPEYF